MRPLLSFTCHCAYSVMPGQCIYTILSAPVHVNYIYVNREEIRSPSDILHSYEDHANFTWEGK